VRPVSGADPFAKLAAFPADLAATDVWGRTRLFNLFQPQPQGRASFRVAMAALTTSGRPKRAAIVARVGATLLVNFPGATVLAALPVAVVAWLLARWLWSTSWCGRALDTALACGAAWTVVLLPTLAGALVVVATWAVWVTLRALRVNHWGLCNGMTQAKGGDAALTPTLHGFFQSLAGRPPGAPPLTFGDLWGLRPDSASTPDEPAPRQIDLQIITTAVSLAQPLRLPGEPGTDPLREFFYDQQEWDDLFPPDVMRHLKTHARPVTLTHDDGRVLLALPPPRQWPVLLAARFSLSFPLLLSAVPMYIAVPRRDALRAGGKATSRPFDARKVYFSDGGITSNCPVHLFDAPLPRFPTFAVNLYRTDGRRRSVKRSDTRDPELDASTVHDAAQWRSALGYLSAIGRTTLDWRDSLQRRLPGYRERVVHIGMPRDVGGLNLAMTPHMIRRLDLLGQLAARRLHRDFSTPRRSGEPNAWERHRWTRARTTLAALRAHLATFVDRLAAGDPDYPRLLRAARPRHDPFPDDASRQQAMDLVDGTRELMRTVDAATPPDALEHGAPQPRPSLHLSPPW
jgi:hypothetical protein